MLCFRALFVLGASVLPWTASETSIPTYSVDLDVPASERWKPVLEDFIARNGVAAFEETYTSWQVELGRVLPKEFAPGADTASQARLLAALERGHPDLVAELRTMSSMLLASKPSPVFELPVLASVTAVYVLGNISPKNTTDTMPHVASACTSTLVRSANGLTLHGRSLDYEPRDAMAKTAVQVEFTRSKRQRVSSYTCLHPLVYPTALQWFTCLRPGAFSLSVNARGQGQWTEHNTTYNELLRRLADPSAKLLGEVAQSAIEAPDYSTALVSLATSQVISSNYFILAGARVGEGAIVTRYGNNSAADVWSLGSGASDQQQSWMRVQTNVDHWVSFESGAYATHRRQHAVNLLKRIGQAKVDGENLWDVYETVSALDSASVARKSPEDTGAILRPTTIATLVISPAKGTFKTCVWASSPHLSPPGMLRNSTQRLPSCYGSFSKRQAGEPMRNEFV